MLGAFFWGYFITTLPGGLLAELFGGRRVVGYALGISGVLTALTPWAAEWSFWAVYAVRVITGLLGVCAPHTISGTSMLTDSHKFTLLSGCILSIIA